MDHITLMPQVRARVTELLDERAADRISVFFPVYNDERTVRVVAEKALKLINEEAAGGEVIIIDDGSPDRSGAIADELAQEHPEIRVIHHPRNLGYGAAIRAGLTACAH